MTTATRAPAPVDETRSASHGLRLPGGLEGDPLRRGAALAGLGLVALGLGVYGGTTTVPSSALAMWIVSGLAVPLWLFALRPRGVLILGLAVMALLGPAHLRTLELVGLPEAPQEAAHDGGVHVTRAAADDVLAGRNPYAQSFAGDLPPSWDVLSVVPGERTPNPIVDHMPYLPAAFLVAVPGVILERAVGVGGDPRWVMGLIVFAAAVLVARRPEPEWARAAAIFAMGSSFTIIYSAWGTNDAAAAALVVVAALWARRRPELAGVALAIAIAYKAPMFLAVVPWVVWIVRQQGWAALRRWWTAPAVLAVTTLPFLLWSPADLVNDTVSFWLGRIDRPFPSSGLGIAYRWPGVAESPWGSVLTVGFAAAGLAAACTLVRWLRHPAVLPVASALVLLGLFVPARTFQPNYLALVTGLIAAGWLLVPDLLPGGQAVPPADRHDELGSVRGVMAPRLEPRSEQPGVVRGRG